MNKQIKTLLLLGALGGLMATVWQDRAYYSLLAGQARIWLAHTLNPNLPPRFETVETPYTQTSTRHPAPCPTQGYFFIAIGQSNSANAIQPSQGRDENAQAYNIYAGQCYQIEDPVLGASNVQGSLWSSFAQQLYSLRQQPVVVLTSGSGNSAVGEWNDERFPYFARLQQQLVDAAPSQRQQKPIIIWHQGEADGQIGTARATYTAQLDQLFNHVSAALAAAGYTQPPAFNIFQASKCGWGATSRPEILAAQAELARMRTDTQIIMNTDTLDDTHRETDGCHFSQTGKAAIVQAMLQKFATADLPE